MQTIMLTSLSAFIFSTIELALSNQSKHRIKMTYEDRWMLNAGHEHLESQNTDHRKSAPA